MYLKILRGSSAGTKIAIPEGETVVGRVSNGSKESFIDLAPFDSEETVSRHHLKLVKQGAALKVEDLGSLNGSYKIASGDATSSSIPLERGTMYDIAADDQLLVGKVLVKIEP